MSDLTPDQENVIRQFLQFPRPTTTATSRLLAGVYSDDLRLVDSQTWRCWTGRHWQTSPSTVLYAKLVELIGHVHRIAASDPTWVERARRLDATNKLHAAVQWAQHDSLLQTKREAFDSHPWLFNCANGTIDLSTNPPTLRPPSRTDYLSRSAPVPYLPDAKAPRWTQFITEVCCGDEDLATYLQQVLGYSMTGDVSEQVFFVLQGGGANGKSTLAATLRAVLGPCPSGGYMQNARPESFMGSRKEATRQDLAALADARFVWVPEASRYAKYDDATIKTLVGDDSFVARFLYHNDQTFKTQFKIFVASNPPPTFSAVDDATWRRLHLIPFAAVFLGDKADKSLPSKLLTEAPGILAWLVRGCQDWKDRRLVVPKAVRNATRACLNRQDPLNGFYRECCRRDPDSQVPLDNLFDEFQLWRRLCGMDTKQPATVDRLGRFLEGAGHLITYDDAGERHVSGVSLNSFTKESR